MMKHYNQSFTQLYDAGHEFSEEEMEWLAQSLNSTEEFFAKGIDGSVLKYVDECHGKEFENEHFRTTIITQDNRFFGVLWSFDPHDEQECFYYKVFEVELVYDKSSSQEKWSEIRDFEKLYNRKYKFHLKDFKDLFEGGNPFTNSCLITGIKPYTTFIDEENIDVFLPQIKLKSIMYTSNNDVKRYFAFDRTGKWRYGRMDFKYSQPYEVYPEVKQVEVVEWKRK